MSIIFKAETLLPILTSRTLSYVQCLLVIQNCLGGVSLYLIIHVSWRSHESYVCGKYFWFLCLKRSLWFITSLCSYHHLNKYTPRNIGAEHCGYHINNDVHKWNVIVQREIKQKSAGCIFFKDVDWLNSLTQYVDAHLSFSVQ